MQGLFYAFYLNMAVMLYMMVLFMPFGMNCLRAHCAIAKNCQ